jgi:hypothetical protein
VLHDFMCLKMILGFGKDKDLYCVAGSYGTLMYSARW